MAEEYTPDVGPFDDTEAILLQASSYIQDLTKLPEKFPDRLKEIFWAFHTKDIMLANLDRQDIISLKNRIGLAVAVVHLSEPDYEYTDERFRDYTNLKNFVTNASLRGKEGFERVMETQQTRMAITSSETPGASLVSPRRQGFVGRTLSRLTGGGR